MARYSDERRNSFCHHMNLPLAIHSVIHPDQKASDFGKSVLRALDDFAARFGKLPGAITALKPLWTHAWDLDDPEFWSVISAVFLALNYAVNGNAVLGFGRKIGVGTTNADITIRRADGIVTQVDV